MQRVHKKSPVRAGPPLDQLLASIREIMDEQTLSIRPATVSVPKFSSRAERGFDKVVASRSYDELLVGDAIAAARPIVPTSASQDVHDDVLADLLEPVVSAAVAAPVVSGAVASALIEQATQALASSQLIAAPADEVRVAEDALVALQAGLVAVAMPPARTAAFVPSVHTATDVAADTAIGTSVDAGVAGAAVLHVEALVVPPAAGLSPPQPIVDLSIAAFPTQPLTPAVLIPAGSDPVARVSGQSFEDAIAAMLRPMLREWLDAHMPRMVEKALRAELGSVVSTSLSHQTKSAGA